MTTFPHAPARRRSRLLLVAAVAVTLILVLGLAAFFYGSRTDAAADPMAGLIPACQSAVKAKLKAPATAQFSGDHQVPRAGRFYQVEGSVDAQNGYGAMVRSRYRCTAESVDGQWTVNTAELLK